MQKFIVGLLCAITLLGSCGAVANAEIPHRDWFVLLRTDRGSILMRIYYSMVPYTAGAFLDLVTKGFYNGLSFHRVEDWVIQGGDPNGNGTGNYVDPKTGRARYLRLQVDRRLNHGAPGMVAMARSQDPNSASCQFYILKRAMSQLDGQYAVFGKVVRGQGTVNSIGVGDRIVSAQIVDPNSLQPIDPTSGGADGGSGDSGGSSGEGGGQAVPGVPDPPKRQSTPPPTGDAGF